MSDVKKNIGTHKPEFDGEWVRLTELCKPKQWKTIPKASLKQDGYPVYGANGVIGYSDSYNHENETILVGCRGTCGQINVCRPRSYVTGNAMCLDELSEDVDLRYLEQFLRAFDFKAIISGSSQPQITRQGLSKVLVPVRPLDEQRTIADNLGKLSQLENLCERQLSAFDDLVKSQFVEMFGDPVSNARGWSVATLGSTCEIVTGNTPSRSDSANYGDYLEWCKTDNITSGKYLTPAVELLSKTGAAKARSVPSGSILMACIAGSINSIGRVAIADRKVSFNQQINALVPGERLNRDYLYWMLRLSKDYLCTGVNMQLKGILNKSTLSGKEFPLPPLALQRQFADFVERVDKLGFDVQQQIEKLETLKRSLMQEYFG